jgi:hypothetical protein
MNKITSIITIEKKTRLLEINRLAAKRYYQKNRERVIARVKAYQSRVNSKKTYLEAIPVAENGGTPP